MFSKLNKINEKLEFISSFVVKFNGEKNESEMSSSNQSRPTSSFRSFSGKVSSPKEFIRNDCPESREIFTQNRNSSSSSYEATPVPLYQNASNLKDKDSRLKDFKLEFEKKFNETIPDTNKLDKFTDLEKNYPEALKRFKGNNSFYSLIKNLK